MPEGRSCRAPDGRQVRRGARAAATLPATFSARAISISRSRTRVCAEEEAHSGRPAQAGEGTRHPAGGHQRQPLSLRRRFPRAGRDAVHPDGQVDRRHQPAEVRRQPVLREELPRDGEGLSGYERCWRARWRSPSAATSSWKKCTIRSRSSRCRPAIRIPDYFEHVAREGFAQRLKHAARAAGRGPPEAFAGGLRAAAVARDRDHPADAVLRILPHRVGLHPLRQGAQHSRRAGPWIGGRFVGRVCAGHHRHRSACRTSCCSSAS